MKLLLFAPILSPGDRPLTKPIKHVEKAVAVAANAAWFVFDKLNSINPNPSFTPKWSDKPLLKSWEKQKPKLGWPRETDSLCRSEERRVGKECRSRRSADH